MPAPSFVNQTAYVPQFLPPGYQANFSAFGGGGGGIPQMVTAPGIPTGTASLTMPASQIIATSNPLPFRVPGATQFAHLPAPPTNPGYWTGAESAFGDSLAGAARGLGGGGGVFGTSIGAGMRGFRPLSGLKGAGVAAGAGMVANGIVDEALSGRQGWLNPRGNVFDPNDPTQGTVATMLHGAANAVPFIGTRFGGPVVAAAAAGAGIGQGAAYGLKAAADDEGIRNWANSYEDSHYDPALYYGKKMLSGALNVFGDGRDVSVSNAVGNLPQFIVTGDKDAKSIAPEAARVIAEAGGKQQQADTDKLMSVDKLAQSPDGIAQYASRFGLSDRATAELAQEWAIKNEELKVGVEMGSLQVPTGDKDAKGNPVMRVATAADLPALRVAYFNQAVSEMPQLAMAERQQQAAAAAADQARAQQVNDALSQAFVYSQQLAGLNAPIDASLAANPYTAPFAGLMQWGSQQQPFNVARDLINQQHQHELNQQAQLAQQQQAMDRAYQTELARLKAQRDARAQSGSADALTGAVPNGQPQTQTK